MCLFIKDQGEPIYNPYDQQVSSTYTGGGAGIYSNSIGAGGYHARNKQHSVSEGWIQCGYCYAEYKKEIDKLGKYHVKMGGWALAGFITCAIPAFAYACRGEHIGHKWGGFLNILIIVGGGSLLAGGLGGMTVYRLFNPLPATPDRYRTRKNPFRDTLIWKRDNDGNPAKVNEYGMIIDPERDEKK